MQFDETEVDPQGVYLTLLVLYILKQQFNDKKDEWEMIAQKAKDFLKDVGVARPDGIVKKFTLKIAI